MTSPALRSSESYIRLLLETQKDQAVLLLSNPTQTQLNALIEIVENLLELNPPADVKAALKRNRPTLKKLAKRGSSFRAKLRIWRKHAKLVLKLFLLIKNALLALLLRKKAKHELQLVC